MALRTRFASPSIRDDAVAGLVLGVESIPDGLAAGLLAGVNPVAGLYAYMYGVAASAVFTSTAFMAVQGTGAMAIIIADVPGLSSGEDAPRMLFTLAILTGLIMLLAGLLKAGQVLRYVSNSVMVGFITAVGINIVLGQVGDFTAYDADGAGRILRTIDTLLNPGQVDLPTIVVGSVTIALIVWLQRTRLGALGLVVAIVAGSGLAAVFGETWREVALLRDVADIPRALPLVTLPLLDAVPSLLVPAFALAFVGLVQGAGVSAAFPNTEGNSDQSADFTAQGIGNIASGLFQGMPVGGSMSASSLLVAAGARSRLAGIFAGGVMAVMVLLASDLIGYIAMPALAGLLIVIGVGTVKPANVMSVIRAGRVQATVMVITLVLTLTIPLQFAVLVGVAISIILYVISQSNVVTTRRLVIAEGRMREEDPPAQLVRGDVVVLQPYGDLFFAAASRFEEQLPVVTEESGPAVVIIRLRGQRDLGVTLIEVLKRYAATSQAAGCKLMLVYNHDRLRHQLDVTGATEAIGPENLYRGTEWLRESVMRARDDAEAWVSSTSPH